eukprot:TRINITY_DN3615_c1_g1_i1.p1 TRINITY_DN3615_c1_g1~~TRINITY_DN3615_c1_g1_i1.p1  ORF type:complete len:630 (-),score=56.68 TRINITY_DN3615_c1_g1_i1:41-1675(-)
MSGQVDITVRNVSENSSAPSLLTSSAEKMPKDGKRANRGRILGDIIIRQPEERPNKSTPVREWIKDACVVLEMVGANSEPSRKGCFDVTDLICDHPRSYCMRTSDQCFAGSVRVPRGMKVTMYNLMADWSNVCEADKTIVVEEARTNRTGDITFWKYGYQDPRRRVCSFKFEKLPGWTCNGGQERTHRSRGRRQANGIAKARENEKKSAADVDANVEVPSESTTSSSPAPPPSKANHAGVDAQNSQADKQRPSPKPPAIRKQFSSSQNPDPNYYYNIEGDAIYVEPSPPVRTDVAEYRNEGNRIDQTYGDDRDIIDSKTIVNEVSNSDDESENYDSNRKSMLSYQSVHRIMPNTAHVIEEIGANDMVSMQDNSGHMIEPQARMQLVQSQGQLVQSQQPAQTRTHPMQSRTQPGQLTMPIAQSRAQPLESRRRPVQASLSSRTRVLANRTSGAHDRETVVRRGIVNGDRQGASGGRRPVSVDGGSVNVGAGGGAGTGDGTEFELSRMASTLQTNSSLSVAPAGSLVTIEDSRTSGISPSSDDWLD